MDNKSPRFAANGVADMKTYYLDCWLGKDGKVSFVETDAQIMRLYEPQLCCQYTFRGARATVVIYSASECIFKFAALETAINFMSGNYRTYSLKTWEWENGVEH